MWCLCSEARAIDMPAMLPIYERLNYCFFLRYCVKSAENLYSLFRAFFFCNPGRLTWERLSLLDGQFMKVMYAYTFVILVALRRNEFHEEFSRAASRSWDDGGGGDVNKDWLINIGDCFNHKLIDTKILMFYWTTQFRNKIRGTCY